MSRVLRARVHLASDRRVPRRRLLASSTLVLAKLRGESEGEGENARERRLKSAAPPPREPLTLSRKVPTSLPPFVTPFVVVQFSSFSRTILSVLICLTVASRCAFAASRARFSASSFARRACCLSESGWPSSSVSIETGAGAAAAAAAGASWAWADATEM